MLTVLLVICIIASIIIGICASRCDEYNEDAKFVLCFLTAICVVAAIGFGIACSILWCNVATEYTIDQKIEMYQEENAEIETEIDTIVKEYMAHEKETFEEIAPDYDGDTMVLVSLFPELKSDELVKQQIDLHARNTAEIKRLKESKIDLATKK